MIFQFLILFDMILVLDFLVFFLIIFFLFFFFGSAGEDKFFNSPFFQGSFDNDFFPNNTSFLIESKILEGLNDLSKEDWLDNNIDFYFDFNSIFMDNADICVFFKQFFNDLSLYISRGLQYFFP